MTTYLVTTQNTGMQTLATGDVFILTEPASITAILGVSGTGTVANLETQIFGDVYGVTAGVSVTGPGNTLYIGETGSVSAAGSLGHAINFYGNSNRIVNYGQIASDEYAIHAVGAGNILRNGGTISASSGNGVYFQGDNTTPGSMMSNTGVITGHTCGVSQNYAGLSFDLFNSGTIIGDTIYGVEVHAVSNITAATLVNDGIIRGGIASIWTLHTIDDLSNSGMLFGNVDLDAYDDVVTNSGGIVGDVLLGSGADVYRGVGAGYVTGTVFGDAGNDTLRGGDGSDSLSGRDGSDLLRGNAGDDVVRGEADNDTLYGQTGDDTLDGGDGDDLLYGMAGSDAMHGGNRSDTLIGWGGDDTLAGDGATDRLQGGSGNDHLIGGWGADVLFGGDGADMFVLESGLDSTNANADHIRDFVQAEDIIDLFAIDHTSSFGFLGTAAFTGTGGMELRYSLSGGHALVTFDINGDGVADGSIWVHDQSVMTASDFVL